MALCSAALRSLLLCCAAFSFAAGADVRARRASEHAGKRASERAGARLGSKVLRSVALRCLLLRCVAFSSAALCVGQGRGWKCL